MSQFPVTPPASQHDLVVDIGAWQIYQGIHLNGVRAEVVKTFVLGTTSITSTSSAITLNRYSLNGALEKSVTLPGSHSPLYRAKAMTIPVVHDTVTMEDGRIFVAATIPAPNSTTDICVLAYDFDLNLKWQKTYSYDDPLSPVDPYYDNDDAVATCTDQSPQFYIYGPDYNYVAVTGTSKSFSRGLDYVTIAYHKTDGQVLMPPKRFTSSGNYDDVPTAIASSHWPEAGGERALFVTGRSPNPPGNNDPGPDAFLTTAYVIASLNPQNTTGNGAVASGWPRADKGTFPGFSSVQAVPAKMAYFKSHLYVTGTTSALGAGAPPSDMLTIRYNINSPGGLVSQWDFLNGVSSGASRADAVSDMDTFISLPPFAFGEGFLAITGSSQDVLTGKREAATVLYHPDLTPVWDYGARWGRPGGGNLDAGVSVRIIEAPNEGNQPLAEQAINVYVAVASLSTGGHFDYNALKYFNTIPPAQQNKNPDWLPDWLPYYNNPLTNGHDVPVKLFAELQPAVTFTQFRKLIVTGTTQGGTSLDDWATQFVSEGRLP